MLLFHKLFDISVRFVRRICFKIAGVAQLVEYKLPKLGVAGSNPVARSTFPCGNSWPHKTFSPRLLQFPCVRV